MVAFKNAVMKVMYCYVSANNPGLACAASAQQDELTRHGRLLLTALQARDGTACRLHAGAECFKRPFSA